jgi:hypothetical protein
MLINPKGISGIVSIVGKEYDGVNLERTSQGVRAVATDGTMLAVTYLKEQNGEGLSPDCPSPAPAPVGWSKVIATEDAKAFEKMVPKKPTQEIFSNIIIEETINPPPKDGESYNSPTPFKVAASDRNGGTIKTITPVDRKYPDVDGVHPTAKDFADPAKYDRITMCAEKLMDLLTAAKKVGAFSKWNAAVDFYISKTDKGAGIIVQPFNPDDKYDPSVPFFGFLMPFECDSARLVYDGVNNPYPPEPVVAPTVEAPKPIVFDQNPND